MNSGVILMGNLVYWGGIAAGVLIATNSIISYIKEERSKKVQLKSLNRMRKHANTVRRLRAAQAYVVRQKRWDAYFNKEFGVISADTKVSFK